jgi:hypothetical protein
MSHSNKVAAHTNNKYKTHKNQLLKNKTPQCKKPLLTMRNGFGAMHINLPDYEID